MRWTATSAITILPAQNDHLAPCHAHTRHHAGGSGLSQASDELAARLPDLTELTDDERTTITNVIDALITKSKLRAITGGAG